MINKYRKKSVVIEAMQYTGDNIEELQQFVTSHIIATSLGVEIQTLEGKMLASSGDYIIKGIKGEFYPCKPDIFWETYDLVDEGESYVLDKVEEQIKKAKKEVKE